MSFEILYLGQNGTEGHGSNEINAVRMAFGRSTHATTALDNVYARPAPPGEYDLTPPDDTSPQTLTVYNSGFATLVERGLPAPVGETEKAVGRVVCLSAHGRTVQPVVAHHGDTDSGSVRLWAYYLVRYRGDATA